MSTPQALYRFFSADGELLYVGISLNPGARWKQHRADKPWWLEVANITVEAHPDRESVADAEREAIKRERPKYNLAHNVFSHEAGARMASMLSRMAEPPEQYWDSCPTCGGRNAPDELHPDPPGWFGVYECCNEAWTRTFEAA